MDNNGARRTCMLHDSMGATREKILTVVKTIVLHHDINLVHLANWHLPSLPYQHILPLLSSPKSHDGHNRVSVVTLPIASHSVLHSCGGPTPWGEGGGDMGRGGLA